MSNRDVVAYGLVLLCLFILVVFVSVRRSKIRHIFQPDTFVDSSLQFRSVQDMHKRFTKRRRGDFFDRWAEDLARSLRSNGAVFAAAQGLWDVLTLGGAARRRARANELEVSAYLAQSMEQISQNVSSNLKLCIASTAVHIEHGFKLLRTSQRITNPLTTASSPNASPILLNRVTALDVKAHNLKVRHSHFLEIATAAGAGTATAVGLWGAVQVAGYASTQTAMAGLYGAAAHNAGWAWFGGGSLATGGGGMALGHAVLPGVGIAVGWGVLVTRLHQVANQMEDQIREIERWNDTNMPVLTNFVAVEEKYRSGAEDFRRALEDLHVEVGAASKKLRRFGVLSDWKRKRRVAKGKTYYSLREIEIVDGVAHAVDQFIDRLPASHLN